MRAILMAVAFACLFAVPGHAGWWGEQRDTYQVHRGWRHERVYAGGGGMTCATATAIGLGCGCYAARQFGLALDHYGMYGRYNLKRADEWMTAFRHVAPAADTAAVFPGRHVVKVDEVRRGRRGTEVLLHDAWAVHWASASGKVFVDPRSLRRVGSI